MFRFDVLLKTKQPELEHYYLVRGEDNYRRLVETVKSISRAINHGIFHPAASHIWACVSSMMSGE
jgi:hypothetical protein